MATKFGSDVTQTADLQSAITPKQGVAERPVLLQGLGSLFEQAGAALKAKREGDALVSVSEFTKKQLLVADALDQGRISSSAHARTLMRKNLLDAIDSNPAIAADLIKAQASIVGLPGGADIVQEGTEQEQLNRARKEQLVSAGLLSPDADEATYKTVETTVRVAEEASRQHQMRMQTLDEELKTGQVTESRRKQIEAEREQATVDFMRNAAPAEYLNVENQMKAIMNNPNMTESDKVMALDDMWAKWNSENASRFGDVSERTGSAFAKPFEMLYDNYKKRMTGEINDEELKRQGDRALAAQRAIALTDPRIARLAVTSDLFGNSGMVEVLAKDPASGAFEAYTDYLAGNRSDTDRPPKNPYVKEVGDRAGLKGFLKEVTDGLNSGDQARATAAADAFGVTLDSMLDYEGMLRRDPASAIEIVNWMASPDFLKAAQANPQLLSNAGELRDILERNYDDEVWAMVRREFTNSNVQMQVPVEAGPDANKNPNAPTGNLREMATVPTANGVIVQADKNGISFVASDPNNREMAAEARRLNKELKPVINNTLKAGAHLEGRTDYDNVWNEVAQEFLGVNAQATDDDDGIDLTIKDFEEKAAPILRVVNDSTLTSLIDQHEGGGSYDTLFSHSQRGGGAFEGVDVTNMTIGQAISFADGVYGDWSKRQLGYKATPMGRYQIVGTTLNRVARAMGLSKDTPFDQHTQDAMFAFLAEEALSGKATMSGKRAALRGVWEGFKYASDAQLDQAIMEFERG